LSYVTILSVVKHIELYNLDTDKSWKYGFRILAFNLSIEIEIYLSLKFFIKIQNNYLKIFNYLFKTCSVDYGHEKYE